MKKNDALKKHHFWILFGLVPLFVLIAVLMISSNVGGEVEKRHDEIEGDQEGHRRQDQPEVERRARAVGQGTSTTVDGKQGRPVEGQLGLRQKDLFTWPKSDAFTEFVSTTKVDGKDVVKEIRIEDLKFGDPIPNNLDQYAEFQKPEFYVAEYSTKAAHEDGRRRDTRAWPTGSRRRSSGAAGRADSPPRQRLGHQGRSPPTRSGSSWRTSGSSGRCWKRSRRSTSRWPRSSA